jgi:hypothetical protein
MTVGGRFTSLAVFMAFASLATAANRCVLPSGRISYTDESCESIGGKVDRPMRNEISVVPNSSPVRAGMIDEKSRSATRYGGAKRTPTGAPIITLCYEPANIRKEVTHPQVEATLYASASAWNQGCRVSFSYLGVCGANNQAELSVRWVAFEAKMQFEGKSHRDHAIAAASPLYGIGLNREIDGAAFVRSWRRSIVHEFGHVAGVLHSSDVGDVMYPGGRGDRPTPADYAACNQAIERQYGPPPSHARK